MSIQYNIAVHAVPFFDLLDREVKSVARAVFGSSEGEDEDPALADPTIAGAMIDHKANQRAVSMAMENSHRHLAQGIDAFIRRLPATVRNDATVARSTAYALAGLADERMLHYPAGGLDAWRERLLESELYGSALAGQEVIRQARNSTQGGFGGDDASELLAPFYLAILREGFEGSLRGDTLGLSTLISTLEDTTGAFRQTVIDMAVDEGPRRLGAPARILAVGGISLWLVSGFVFWMALGGDMLDEADRIAERIENGLAATFREDADRTISPSSLPEPASVEEQR